jgi:hypothetical protein
MWTNLQSEFQGESDRKKGGEPPRQFRRALPLVKKLGCDYAAAVVRRTVRIRLRTVSLGCAPLLIQ